MCLWCKRLIPIGYQLTNSRGTPHRTPHTTSWDLCVSFAYPCWFRFTSLCCLRVYCLWCTMATRCLHDGYPRASRSRVIFLPESLDSCIPRVAFVYCWGVIVYSFVAIATASAVFWFYIKFRINFGRNWKFYFCVSIASQNRDSLTRV